MAHIPFLPTAHLRHLVRAIVFPGLALLACAPVPDARAQGQADVLAGCVALSAVDDDVHACLDNYLDTLDERIERTSSEARRVLTGDALSAFERAQLSFDAFRRDNCLWYLAFNTPRDEAEKIAKNCLVRHSLQRLIELQGLLVADTGTVTGFNGHYVFDGTRNSFQPCGSERRFWVGGDDAALASLQQQYLERTSAEGQRLFARLDGALDRARNVRPGHAGLLRLYSVRELRDARDDDCGQPDDAAPVETASPESERARGDATASVDPVPDNPVADPGASGQAEALDGRDGASQQLTAYFGAWFAECEASAIGSECRVAVDLDAAAGSAAASRLTLLRSEDARTRVVLALPPGAAAIPAQVRWRVDGQALEGIQDALLRQSDAGVELSIEEAGFVDERLLPLLRAGNGLRVRTLGDGAERTATLVGLTRALAFADDFIDGGV